MLKSKLVKEEQLTNNLPISVTFVVLKLLKSKVVREVQLSNALLIVDSEANATVVGNTIDFKFLHSKKVLYNEAYVPDSFDILNIDISKFSTFVQPEKNIYILVKLLVSIPLKSIDTRY